MIEAEQEKVRVIKFLTTGATAATAEFIVFAALYQIAGRSFLVMAQTASFLIGFIISFSLNKMWVFRSKAGGRAELIKYSLIALFNIGVSNLLIFCLIHQLFLSPWAAKVFVMSLVAAWNYALFKWVVFKMSD